MKSTKIFFESGYHRIELGIEKIKSTDGRPDLFVMKYTKKPMAASIRIVGPQIENYDSSEDLTVPRSGDVDVMIRNFKRVLKGRSIVPEHMGNYLSSFFKNIQTWNPPKKKLL